jgi:hypothetical protein
MFSVVIFLPLPSLKTYNISCFFVAVKLFFTIMGFRGTPYSSTMCVHKCTKGDCCHHLSLSEEADSRFHQNLGIFHS